MNIINYKSFLKIFILFIFFSCSNSDESVAFDEFSSNLSASNVILRINKTFFDEINNNRINNISEGDFIKVNSGKKNGDFIELSVSYSGGCKLHNFEIIWDGVVYTNNPCNMNFLLVHNSNNDSCEAYVTETIIINLKELLGDVTYSSDCSFNIFDTYNLTNTPTIKI
jgi:hypothetical protein